MQNLDDLGRRTKGPLKAPDGLMSDCGEKQHMIVRFFSLSMLLRRWQETGVGVLRQSSNMNEHEAIPEIQTIICVCVRVCVDRSSCNKYTAVNIETFKARLQQQRLIWFFLHRLSQQMLTKPLCLWYLLFSVFAVSVFVMVLVGVLVGVVLPSNELTSSLKKHNHFLMWIHFWHKTIKYESLPMMIHLNLNHLNMQALCNIKCLNIVIQNSRTRMRPFFFFINADKTTNNQAVICSLYNFLSTFFLFNFNCETLC